MRIISAKTVKRLFFIKTDLFIILVLVAGMILTQNLMAADHPHVLIFGSSGAVNGQFDQPWESSDNIYAADSGNLSIQKRAASQPKAIIVAGGGPYEGNILWNATKMNADIAYIALIRQGYTKDAVYYLSPVSDYDLDGNGYFDDVDAEATNRNFEYAIRTWASDAKELFIYIVDHGGDGNFRMNKNELLWASTLNQWLDAFQTNNPARVTLVYDACRAGSFLPLLRASAGKERILAASTSSDSEAIFAADGIVSYSFLFWEKFMHGDSFFDSFISARNYVGLIYPKQISQIDANGNGIPNEKEDLVLALNVRVGNENKFAGFIPTIDSVSPEQILKNQASALIYAKDIISMEGIWKVWALITPPNYSPTTNDTPVTDLPIVDLLPVGNGRYEASYSGFTVNGTYNISIFATDKSGVTSLPKQTSVSRSKDTCMTVASFTATPMTGIVPLNVQFNAAGSSIDVKSYAWSFGDGATDTTVAPKHQFTKAGSYTVTLTASGDCIEFARQIIEVKANDRLTKSVAKSIIVSGGGNYLSNTLWKATKRNTDFAYESLIFQGYKPENIYYLSEDNGFATLINGTASKENLKYAITSWAMNAADLLIYMTDHGGDGTFRMSETEILNAYELAGWLDSIQQTIPGNVILVYDACRSGSFLKLLKGPKRIILTSASADENAIFASEGTLSFSWLFWSQIYSGRKLYEAFTNSKNSMSLVSDSQHPLIDADGNGISETADLRIAEDIMISEQKCSADDFPTIGSVSPPGTLTNGTSALIYADNVIDANGIKKVWAVITPPNYASYSAVSLPTTELKHVGNNRYEATYDRFVAKGTYKIVIFVTNNRNFTSLPEEKHITSVTQTQGNSCVFVNNDLALNLCAAYLGKRYGFAMNYYPNPDDPKGLYWKMDIVTLRELQSDPGNCISVGSDLKLNMCAEYQSKNYGFTLNYDKDVIWKMDVGSFKTIN